MARIETRYTASLGADPATVPQIDESRLRLHGQDEIFPSVSRLILPGDTMMRGNAAHYFSVGASALAVIRRALDEADRPLGSIARVLDVGCGYGRVLRWLRAAFPDAALVGVDIDPRCVRGAGALDPAIMAERFDATLDPAPGTSLAGTFDLIWVGSVLTHVDEGLAARLLGFLARRLAPAGVAVVTTHGSSVGERMRRGEATYGLERDAIDALLRAFDATGYGFADYARRPGYGIAVVEPSTMSRMMMESGLSPILVQPTGWDRHQDCIAARRTG